MIKGNDIDNLLYKVSKELIKQEVVSPRNLNTKEIINANILLKNPELCIINNKQRNYSKKYLGAELLWYLSGDRNIANIKDYASMWSKIADENNNVNSNYGNIVFFEKPYLENRSYDFNSQYEYVLNSLSNDKFSRQAIINFNQPKHKYKGNKDVVCTINSQYLIRDDVLISIVNMRSNDFIWGYCNDQPFFSFLQMKLVDDLKDVYPELRVGSAYHNVGSLHVYERHFDMLKNIVNEYENNNVRSSKLPYNDENDKNKFISILNNWKNGDV